VAIEKKFIKTNIKLSDVETFLSKEFSRAGYSHVEISRTPVSTRVTVWAQKPGMVIGRGGKTIDALTETLKTKFGMENPALDVQEISNPDLDARIVAEQIVSGIERGLNYKRVVQMTIQRVIQSGAVGVAVRISGKVGGEMSRTEKFNAGYLKYAGDPAEQLSKAYATANVKLGTIGVQVRILTEEPKEIVASKRITKAASEAIAAKQEAVTKAAAEKAAKKEEPPEEPLPDAPLTEEKLEDIKEEESDGKAKDEKKEEGE
jgi:small subunit ribosomal protein S3